eukprot:8318040-Alexandrium_andersonii.AAC.1
MDASGKRHDITSTSGFDQGCPLAALAYALASRPLMEEVTAELQASGVHVVLDAYLDDVTLVFQTEDACK